MRKPKTSPSRIKYDKNHPTVSARIPIETKARLLANLKILGMSLPDAFRVLAGDIEIKVKPIEEARKEGFEEAKNRYMVPYQCAVCGKILVVTSAAEKAAIAKYMLEHQWGDFECHERRQS